MLIFLNDDFRDSCKNQEEYGDAFIFENRTTAGRINASSIPGAAVRLIQRTALGISMAKLLVRPAVALQMLMSVTNLYQSGRNHLVNHPVIPGVRFARAVQCGERDSSLNFWTRTP